jgi:CheY-like chemotaxis protein
MVGGELVVNSEVGTGSTFSFVFPDIYRANWEPEAHEKKPMDENLEQFQPATILVVDNVESNRTLIAEYFANTHHRLLFAKDGREAIEMAQIHQPDVILLDLRMPNLDGRSAAIFLKQDPQTRDIPIIVLTASVAKDELQDMQLFCQGFLRKPVKRFQLVEAFKNILPLNENSPREREVQPPAASAREPMMETPGENLSELAEKLALEEQNQWQQLRQTMKRREVKAFAKRLHAWAREYHCAKLEAYATKISHQLGEFDWENLPATLEEFPQLRQWLEGNGDRA